MPWKPGDAPAKTKKANSPTKKKVWANVANGALGRTGDEGSAIRQANAVTARIGTGKKKKAAVPPPMVPPRGAF